MTDFVWLIEAPGNNYLYVYSGAFMWTKDPRKALKFTSSEQANSVRDAVMGLYPKLFAFAETLGDAVAVEHGFIGVPMTDAPVISDAVVEAAARAFRLLHRDSCWPDVDDETAKSHALEIITAAVLAEREEGKSILEKARRALTPFVFEAKSYDPPEDDDDQLLWGEHHLTVGHLRSARDAYDAILAFLGAAAIRARSTGGEK